jgi:hypothetical protein
MKNIFTAWFAIPIFCCFNKVIAQSVPASVAECHARLSLLWPQMKWKSIPALGDFTVQHTIEDHPFIGRKVSVFDVPKGAFTISIVKDENHRIALVCTGVPQNNYSLERRPTQMSPNEVSMKAKRAATAALGVWPYLVGEPIVTVHVGSPIGRGKSVQYEADSWHIRWPRAATDGTLFRENYIEESYSEQSGPISIWSNRISEYHPPVQERVSEASAELLARIGVASIMKWPPIASRFDHFTIGDTKIKRKIICVPNHILEHTTYDAWCHDFKSKARKTWEVQIIVNRPLNEASAPDALVSAFVDIETGKVISGDIVDHFPHPKNVADPKESASSKGK